MRISNIIPLTEARKRLFDISEEVQEPDNIYVLTKYGKPVAVVMSADDFDIVKSHFKSFPKWKGSTHKARKGSFKVKS